jgi:4-hydroxybenzoate polyprenyltransferase
MQPSAPHAYAPTVDARPRSESLLGAIVRELRPKQWLKNGLLFFGIVYALELFNVPLLMRAAAGFVAFCCISSAGYVLNDLRDVELDRRHPTKRYRPIAAGLISPAAALAIGGALLVVGFAIALAIGPAFAVVCLAYVAITASYSLWLKHIVLLDIFAIAAGFVIRAIAGAVVIDVPISSWLYLCTLMGSLVIALGKRRSEVSQALEQPQSTRPALADYSVGFLDLLTVMAATASVMAYALYTFFAESMARTHAMILTIPIVLYGVFRYLYLVQIKGLGESPEELLLHDRGLGAAVAIFMLVTASILYLPQLRS